MHHILYKEKYCQICSCLLQFHFTLLVFAHFCNELKDSNYKIHWNILVFCHQWKMLSDLNASNGKMSEFVSFQLFGLTAVIKMRNFDF